MESGACLRKCKVVVKDAVSSCQSLSAASIHQIDGQIVDQPADSQPYILIPEGEYLELKNQVGYWKSMHQKALLREEGLKQAIKEKDDQIRDLKNRLFGKKVKRKRQKQKKTIQNQISTKGLVVNNREVKVTD